MPARRRPPRLSSCLAGDRSADRHGGKDRRSTHAMTVSNSDSTSGWAVGFTAFAAMMMILIGFFQAMMGLVAVFNQEFYVATEEYIFALDVGTWGWIHLIWGVI